MNKITIQKLTTVYVQGITNEELTLLEAAIYYWASGLGGQICAEMEALYDALKSDADKKTKNLIRKILKQIGSFQGDVILSK